MATNMITGETYDVLMDNQDDRARKEADRRKVYLGALAWTLSHEAGRHVLADMLRRHGLGLPILSEAAKVLHNAGMAMFRDMEEANPDAAWRVLHDAMSHGRSGAAAHAFTGDADIDAAIDEALAMAGTAAEVYDEGDDDGLIDD